ncbi:hypothetical protein IC620_09475 [Hazenella sp. IB182357]|uniref:Phage tail protein n=1 Tax=Polycladospora coralii TaxID=2771432 RepID=A0A926RU73_9BACL|nr:hypothetical protein [Polycladospora coralii]MBD1372583.1 hypothetical protein [Polycladospora coralii]
MKYLPTFLKREETSADHDAFIGALTDALAQVARDTAQLEQELLFSTATGSWLEQWADWFGVYRSRAESDESLRQRIIACLIEERITIPALEAMTKRILGADTQVHIREPYEEVFRLDDSLLDEHRFGDATYYRIGVVDIAVDRSPTPEWLALLGLIKGAGIQIYTREMARTNNSN